MAERDDNEFHYGGEAHILRPAAPEKLSDGEWAEYLFLKQNAKGPFLVGQSQTCALPFPEQFDPNLACWNMARSDQTPIC